MALAAEEPFNKVFKLPAAMLLMTILGVSLKSTIVAVRLLSVVKTEPVS